LYDIGRVSGKGLFFIEDASMFVFGSGMSLFNVSSGLKDDVGLFGFVHLSKRSDSFSSSDFSLEASSFITTGSFFISSFTSSTPDTLESSYIGRSSHRVVTDFSRWILLNASSESAIKLSMRCAVAGSLLIGRGCLNNGCTSS